MKKYRIDKETGKATFAIVQAEDEIASIGMVIGAGWAGARAMTSTAGPGHLADGRVRRPGLLRRSARRSIFDIQRVGPSTGLPTRTAQGDMLIDRVPVARRHQAHHAASRPRSRSATRWRMEAFDLAEQFQTPVFVMSDLDLGMNNWMSDPFTYPDEADRSRQGARRRRRSSELGEWGRYKDVDGDGIPYRTMPGTEHAARTSRAAPATTRTRPVQRAAGRLREQHGPPGAQVRDGAAVRAEAGRSTRRRRARSASSATARRHWAIDESRDQLRDETGVETALPAPARAIRSPTSSRRSSTRHERVYVVEQNRDAQMLRADAAWSPGAATGRRSCAASLHYNGLPIDARSRSRDDDRWRRGEGTYMADRLPQHGRRTPNRKPHRPRTVTDYQGGKTTLCAGCGHNAISERIIDAFYEMGIDPQQVDQAVGHRLLEQEPGVFPRRVARLQRRARPHAVGRAPARCWPTRS